MFSPLRRLWRSRWVSSAVALALLGGSDAGEADGGVAVAAPVDEAPAVQPAAQPPAEVASEAIVVTRTVSPAPTLEVNIPRPGSLVTQPWVVLVGATEPGTFVAVGAQEADVAVDGRWTLGLALQEGANRITVTATDRNRAVHPEHVHGVLREGR